MNRTRNSDASASTSGDKPLVEGSIIFDEDAKAFSGATVYVRLEDVSYADAAAKTVAEQVMRDVARAAGSREQLGFKLYGQLAGERASYNLRVHVDVDGDGEVSLQDFITMESYPVLTHSRAKKLSVHVHEVK